MEWNGTERTGTERSGAEWSGPNTSFAASARQHATAGFSRLRMNIDRIYSSPSVRWLDFDGTHPFGDKLPRNRFAGLSDHAPLLGRLELAR